MSTKLHSLRDNFLVQVICVTCNDAHTTLTDSYINWYSASEHMHVRDLSEGEFVCEWCRLCACTSCGEYSTVGSALAKPGLWMNPEQFVCTACGEADKTVGNRTDFTPIYKVSSFSHSLLTVNTLLLC